MALRVDELARAACLNMTRVCESDARGTAVRRLWRSINYEIRGLGQENDPT